MRGNGAIRMGLAFATLFLSLSLVVWRQSRTLETLRALETARSAFAVLEAERAEMERSLQWLESRSRIVAVAGERFGLRVPAAAEIVILRPAPDRLPGVYAAATAVSPGARE